MVSYVFEGPKWRTGPITWSYADTTYAADQAKAPFSSVITSATYQATIERAIQKWADVTGLVFQEVFDTVVPGDAADIRIGFGLFNNAAANTATYRAIGQTNYRFNQSNQLFNTDVVVRLDDPNEIPLVSTNGQLAYGAAGGSTFYQVVLHELGHALGLNHSTSPIDVMSPILFLLNPGREWPARVGFAG